MTKNNQLLAVMARSALSAFVLVALALPASAKVVEFNSIGRGGLGAGGNPPTTPSYQPNGLPVCQKGLQTHLNASVPGHGFANVNNGAFPQSVMDVRPYKNGTAGPTGAFPVQSMPGVAGVNGAAEYVSATCVVAFTAGFLPAILNARTQSSRFTGPANNTVFINPAATTISGGMAARHQKGTMLSMHTLAAGMGPGNRAVLVNAPPLNQKVTIVQGGAKFGGGWRASGGGRVNLGVNLGPGLTAMGYWLSGPRMLGHHQSQLIGGAVTQVVTMSGIFTRNDAVMFPVFLKAWNFPFTTGTGHAEDHGGAYVTIRDPMGNDGRTSMGENGTLLLISPWTANLAQLNLYFSGTGEVEFNFLPEPGPTAMLAAGVLGILVLHIAYRRRK